MPKDKIHLPELVLLVEYKGVFNEYLESVYKYFQSDFIISKPSFRGTRLGLKKHPMSDGKEATFWHLTSEGESEAERTPDLRRMERIRWPRPIIDNSEDSCLKVWENQRKHAVRILLWFESVEYLVILAKRKDYLLPWTAYLVLDKPRKEKLQKEYDAFLKAKTAQQS